MPCLSGVLAGVIIRSDSLGLKAFRLPKAFTQIASRLLRPVLGSTRSPRRSTRTNLDDEPAFGVGVSSAFQSVSGLGPATTTQRESTGRANARGTGGALNEWRQTLAGVSQAR